MMLPLFNVVYSDPPWSFSSKQLQKYSGSRFHSLSDREYPVLKTDDIRKLPVNELTADDAALFLWVTDAHLKDGISVIEDWGFKYVTVAFVWSKKTSTGKQVATLGSWTMKNCELCLFGTKGKMLRHKKSNNVYQLIESERTSHSSKPLETYDRIESIFPDVPYIEVFSRVRRDGWVSVGNDVDGMDIRASLAKVKVAQKGLLNWV